MEARHEEEAGQVLEEVKAANTVAILNNATARERGTA
jgi:hypothetical protein